MFLLQKCAMVPVKSFHSLLSAIQLLHTHILYWDSLQQDFQSQCYDIGLKNLVMDSLIVFSLLSSLVCLILYWHYKERILSWSLIGVKGFNQICLKGMNLWSLNILYYHANAIYAKLRLKQLTRYRGRITKYLFSTKQAKWHLQKQTNGTVNISKKSNWKLIWSLKKLKTNRK